MAHPGAEGDIEVIPPGDRCASLRHYYRNRDRIMSEMRARRASNKQSKRGSFSSDHLIPIIQVGWKAKEVKT